MLQILFKQYVVYYINKIYVKLNDNFVKYF